MENAKKYESKFSPGKLITAEQLLAEVMCQRFAKTKNIELPIQFWKIKSYKNIWLKEYLKQLRFATTLTKLYSPQAISAALKTSKGKKVFSLGANFLDDLIKEEERKIELLKIIQPKIESIEEEKTDLPLNRPLFKGKRNLKDKLDEI